MGRGGGGGGRSGGSSHSSSRSSGGGSHSRSFGGSSSSSSRGGSSYRSSSSTHRGGGGPHVGPRPGPGMPPPPPPRRRYWGHHYGYGHTRVYYGSSSGLVAAIIIFVIIFMVLAASGGHSGNSHDVTSSTVEREALKPYASFDKNCVDDDAGWITNRNTLLKGMESFYKQTGVQPALAIYESVDGKKYLSSSDIEDFMYDEYDDLIGHERGVLLLFCEYTDSDYYVYYMAGEDAQTVMDSEACDILIDYVHAMYTSNMSDEEYFSEVFSKTADRIMSVTPTVASKIPTIVFGIVIIGAFITIVVLVKQKHKRDAERAAETERILNTHIDHI